MLILLYAITASILLKISYIQLSFYIFYYLTCILSVFAVQVSINLDGDNISCMIEYNQRIVSQAKKTKGYLYKKSTGLMGSWQKRFFIILNNALCYFEDETLEQIKKTINLIDISYIKLVQDKQFQLITKRRVYELRANDEANRDLWAASLDILINHKEGQATINTSSISSPKLNNNTNRHTTNQVKKEVTSKRQSKQKKMNHRFQSSASLRSNSPSRSSHWKLDYSPQNFLSMICLQRLSQRWRQQSIKNKIILMKQVGGCYFVISCKTLLTSSEDEDFLSEDLIYPYEFNTLYYFAFEKMDNPQVVEIGKCCQINQITAENAKTINILIKNKTVNIELQHRRMQLIDIYGVIRKIKSSINIGKEYHNQLGIKIKRNCDKMLKEYKQKEQTIENIVEKQLKKCIIEAKQGNIKAIFRKNLQNLKKCLREVINCCDVKPQPPIQFKEDFIHHFNQAIYDYVHKMWGSLSKGFTFIQLKKISVLLFDLWKIVKNQINDERMYQGSLEVQKFLIEKYAEDITRKMDSCFDLSEKEILDQVNIDIKNQENQHNSSNNAVFLSNTIFRQFHLDIRLVLYQFPEMPIHQQSLRCYMHLFLQMFKHISEKTFKNLDKWRDSDLILGTCNEIQFIKNILFDEMTQTFVKEYPNMTHKIKKQLIKDLQNEICNIEIMLIKKLFVLTFSDIDRNILGKGYEEFDIGLICTQIIQKLLKFTKINKYVKRNIFEASFEEICYFYFTILIKYNPPKQNLMSVECFAMKLTEDIKTIGKSFENYIYQQKIYTHLKDLNLLKEFVQCDISQVKKMCTTLKKQFGNSFTETAVKNLLNLRDINDELKDDLLNECHEIVKSSADTPQEISLVSSSRQSFLQNWNNTRSRKSTLTLSLNQFYQNQQVMYQNKHKCAEYKQGYLMRKKINKNVHTYEIRSFFKISNGLFEEYESENTKEDAINIFDLHSVRKCYLHPDKNYIFIIEFPENKLQLKAETSDEAKEWIKNIYEEISSLNMTKQAKGEKSNNASIYFHSLKNQGKEGSTMEHSPLIGIDKIRSKEKMRVRVPKLVSKKIKKQCKQKKIMTIVSDVLRDFSYDFL